MIYKTLHRKLKIEQTNLTKTGGELMCFGMVNYSCSTSDTHQLIWKSCWTLASIIQL